MEEKATTEDWAIKLASKFHETYERLAPRYGYETRWDTRTFNPISPNGRLMCAVMESIAMPELTDAEQEAIAFFAELRGGDFDSCLPHAAALRNLLKRASRK